MELEEYSDTEIEELATIYMDRIRALMQCYSLIYAEGVHRRIESFLDPQISLLSEEQKTPVVEHVKKLNAQQLIEHVYRYKDMSSCFRITLDEIKKRLVEIEQ